MHHCTKCYSLILSDYGFMDLQQDYAVRPFFMTLIAKNQASFLTIASIFLIFKCSVVDSLCACLDLKND